MRIGGSFLTANGREGTRNFSDGSGAAAPFRWGRASLRWDGRGSSVGPPLAERRSRFRYWEFAAKAMSATMMITSSVTNATFHALSGKRAWAVPVTALTAPCQVLPRYW